MNGRTGYLVGAALCALLAAMLTFTKAGGGAAERGELRSVVRANAALAAGRPIDEQQAAALEVVQLPADATPPDALADPAETAGLTPLVDLPEGSLLTDSIFAGADQDGAGFKLRPRERALSVDVVVSPVGGELRAGMQVDLLASGFRDDQTTRPLVDRAEVLAVERGEKGKARLTLRLAVGQLSAVIRGDVFAQELRAVVVPEAATRAGEAGG